MDDAAAPAAVAARSRSVAGRGAHRRHGPSRRHRRRPAGDDALPRRPAGPRRRHAALLRPGTSMARSLEVRVPFLDHQVVELPRRRPPASLTWCDGRDDEASCSSRLARGLDPGPDHRQAEGRVLQRGGRARWFRAQSRGRSPIISWLRIPAMGDMIDRKRGRGGSSSARPDGTAHRAMPMPCSSILMLEVWLSSYLPRALGVASEPARSTSASRQHERARHPRTRSSLRSAPRSSQPPSPCCGLLAGPADFYSPQPGSSSTTGSSDETPAIAGRELGRRVHLVGSVPSRSTPGQSGSRAGPIVRAFEVGLRLPRRSSRPSL